MHGPLFSQLTPTDPNQRSAWALDASARKRTAAQAWPRKAIIDDSKDWEAILLGRVNKLRGSEPDRHAVQVVSVRALDLHGGNLADAQRAAARDIDRTVDLRRIALAAALRNRRTHFVDDHLLAG